MSTINLGAITLESVAVKRTLEAMGKKSEIEKGAERFPGFVLHSVRSWYGDNTSKAVRVGDKVQTAKEFSSGVKQTWGSKSKLGAITTEDKNQFLILNTGPERQLVDVDKSFLELERHGINLEFSPVEGTDLGNWLADQLALFIVQQRESAAKKAVIDKALSEAAKSAPVSV